MLLLLDKYLQLYCYISLFMVQKLFFKSIWMYDEKPHTYVYRWELIHHYYIGITNVYFIQNYKRSKRKSFQLIIIRLFLVLKEWQNSLIKILTISSKQELMPLWCNFNQWKKVWLSMSSYSFLDVWLSALNFSWRTDQVLLFMTLELLKFVFAFRRSS